MQLNARLNSLALWYRQNTKTVIAAAAAALIAAAAIYVVEEMRLRDQRIAANDHETRIRAVLTAPDATLRTASLPDAGTVTLISSPQRDAALVIVTLQKEVPVELDETYQIWFLEGSNSKSIGLMAPEELSTTLVINGLEDARRLGVTVEPAAGATSPTLPLIAEIALTR